MRSAPEVLLVYPGNLTSTYRTYSIPISLLHISKALKELGIQVSIFDSRKDSLSKLVLKNYLFVGITMMTGDMIVSSLKIAGMVKRHGREIPVVAGGVHPSLLPEQTLENELIDVVVIGEGEKTVQELSLTLMAGGDLSRVKGIGYKDKNNRITITPPREFLDMNQIGVDLPYDDLGIDMIDYARNNAFPVNTSRGCPYRCGFCYNAKFNKRSYRYKDASTVVDEIEFIVKRYHAREINFGVEDEFFINTKRVYEICELLLKKNMNISWSSFCRFNTFDKIDDDFIDLIKKAGCNFLLFGGESGSERILDEIIRKDISIDQIIRGTERLNKVAIPHMVSFMCCLPTETRADLEATFSLIDRISMNNSKLFINGIFMFTPFPGTSLFDLVKNKYDFRQPESLEEWGCYNITKLPSRFITWCSKEHLRLCNSISGMSKHLFYSNSSGSFDSYKKYLAGTVTPYLPPYPFYLFARIQRWRFMNRYFKYPIDHFLYKIIDRYVPLLIKMAQAFRKTRSLFAGSSS